MTERKPIQKWELRNERLIAKSYPGNEEKEEEEEEKGGCGRDGERDDYESEDFKAAAQRNEC